MTNTLIDTFKAVQYKGKREFQDIQWTQDGVTYKVASLQVLMNQIGRIARIKLHNVQVDGSVMYSAELEYIIRFDNGFEKQGELFVDTTVPTNYPKRLKLKKTKTQTVNAKLLWWAESGLLPREIKADNKLFPFGISAVVVEMLKQV